MKLVVKRPEQEKRDMNQAGEREREREYIDGNFSGDY